MIIEDLKALARPIEDLNLDPANANLHPGESIEGIKASLRQYGQRKPVVCQKNPKTGLITVRAGNGTLEAARALGWTEIAAVIVEEDDLSATGFAIVDNRTAEFSKRDPSTLASLLGVLENDERNLIDPAIYSAADIDEMLKREQEAIESLGGDDEGEGEGGGQESPERGGEESTGPDYTGDPVHPDFRFQILQGDVLDRLKDLPENSVDAIFCDPPYGFSFMGKRWDKATPSPEIWAEALRVLKPGGYLMAYAGDRTFHSMVSGIEEGGFEIRNMLFWMYGTGFPKAHDVAKAIEDADGVAAPWAGYKSALKPAVEPICLAMKPMQKTYHENAEEFGLAGLNIDAARIDRENMKTSYRPSSTYGGKQAVVLGGGNDSDEVRQWENTEGGYPSNLILGEELSDMIGAPHRYFYSPKASVNERELGLESFESEQVNDGRETSIDNPYQRGDTLRKNIHPTVKPLDLNRYFAALIRPPNDRDERHGPTTLLVPFSGSGSEIIGAMLAGWQNVIGIEIDPDYIEIAKARIAHWQHTGKK